MNFLRLGIVSAALVAAGCVSSSSFETRLPTEGTLADGRRRAEAHTALAGEYYSRGSYGVALQETRLALTYDPNLVSAWNMQGLIFMELREDVPAREAFDRAMRMEPNNPEVLNNYGWFLCLRDEHARALDLLNRASNNPLYPTPEKAFLSTGLCLRRVGRLAESEALLRRAVAIRPDMIGALYNLAELTFARGAVKDAENFIARYMRISQPTIESLGLGVKIARAGGDRAAEDSYLQQLRRRFPDSPETREAVEGHKP